MVTATDFKVKNETRRKAYRAARDENRRSAREARTLRRALHGAFGTEPVEIHNTAVFGTTGTPKEDKG